MVQRSRLGRVHFLSPRSWATAIVAAVTLGGCLAPGAAPSPDPPVPTRAEAAAVLDEAVALARAGDFAGLCAMGGGNCEQILRIAGTDALPAAKPTVLEELTLPEDRDTSPSGPATGRLLVVCGVDGRGAPYVTDVVITWGDGRWLAVEPIYWSGLSIGGPPHERRGTSPEQLAECQSSSVVRHA